MWRRDFGPGVRTSKAQRILPNGKFLINYRNHAFSFYRTAQRVPQIQRALFPSFWSINFSDGVRTLVLHVFIGIWHSKEQSLSK